MTAPPSKPFCCVRAAPKSQVYVEGVGVAIRRLNGDRHGCSDQLGSPKAGGRATHLRMNRCRRRQDHRHRAAATASAPPQARSLNHRSVFAGGGPPAFASEPV